MRGVPAAGSPGRPAACSLSGRGETASRINPQDTDNDDSSTRPVASTAVGNRGTRPVCRNSSTTGTPRPMPRLELDHRGAGKYLKRPLMLDEAEDRPEDPHAIDECIQLRTRSCGAVAVLRTHLPHRHMQRQGMDREFRFRFETRGQRRERFHEAAAEHAVAGQQIGDCRHRRPMSPSRTAAGSPGDGRWGRPSARRRGGQR